MSVSCTKPTAAADTWKINLDEIHPSSRSSLLLLVGYLNNSCLNFTVKILEMLSHWINSLTLHHCGWSWLFGSPPRCLHWACPPYLSRRLLPQFIRFRSLNPASQAAQRWWLTSDSADFLGLVVKLARHGGLFQSNPRLWSERSLGLISSTNQRALLHRRWPQKQAYKEKISAIKNIGFSLWYITEKVP